MGQSVTWRAVMSAVAARQWEGRPLTGITEDSREVRPGGVFVARRGRTWDGRAFAAAAAAAGALLLVAEAECDVPVAQCVVPSAAAALSALAALWHGEPARHLRLVGITGTNGKTTVARLAGAVFGAAGVPAWGLGTLGVWVDGRRIRQHLPWTTPPAPTLHASLADMRAAGAAVGVLEVSAQALDQHRVDDCPFEVAAVTGIAREHGEYFADETAYREAKLRLFSAARPAGPPAWAVVHSSLASDSAWSAASPERRITYGHGDWDVYPAACHVRGLEGTDLGVALRTGRRRRKLALRLQIPGAHNVDNALCVVAIGTAMGLSPADIVQGLESVAHVPGRMQHVVREPYRVLVDYAHNPAGLRATLSAVRQATSGRLCLVMGARGQRDRGKRPLMGAVAAALCDRVVLTSDQPAGEDPEEAALPMRRAAIDCGAPVEFVPSRVRALEAAVSWLRPGDSLVVTGKGDEEWRGDGEAGLGTTDAGVLADLLRVATAGDVQRSALAAPSLAGGAR